MACLAISTLLFSALVASAFCHEPLTNGTSVGPDWNTYQTALRIPSNKFSLVARRWSNAQGPVFWLKYNAQAGDELYLTAGSGAALPYRALRGTAWVFGEKLPNKYSGRWFKVPVPIRPRFRYSVFKSAANLSNCNFLTTAYGRGSYGVQTYNGTTRCGSYNNVTGTGSFPFFENKFTAPATGLYYIAIHLDQTWDAGWFVSTGSAFHGHDENHTLPIPPVGNAAQINTGALNLTLRSFLGGVNVLPFSIKY